MSSNHTPLTPGEPVERRASGARATGQTILLVEDEESVREFVRVVLEHAGYVVVTATDGDQGLAQYLADPNRFDLVLSDVMMPNRTGPELATILRHVRPGIRILFMSAYVGGTPAKAVEMPPDVFLIEKPFSLDRLLHTVAQTLKASAPG